LPVIQSVSVIILTAHHLSAYFRPKELIDSGWNIRAVAGVQKRRSKQHQHRGDVAILYRNASNLKIEQHRITDGSNGSSHQAVSWTIHSPLIADPIHITVVYVSPSEGEVEEFFHTLTQQDHYPDREIHVYAGDFNAHVAEEIEAHITLQERSTIPSRVGDCHRRHIPSPPDAPAITNARISSQQRGRLLLRMLITTSFLILNGRFETVDDSIPYTLQRQEVSTINDYNLIAKQHLSKVKSCYVIPSPSRSLRSNSGPPTDHNQIVLHLSLPVKLNAPSASAIATTPEPPPRTQFHSSKLKDPAVRTLFSDALEDQAAKSESVIKALRISLEQGNISPNQYADKVNTIIVSALQVTADRVLGKTEFRSQRAQKEHMTQKSQQENGNYSSNHKRIAAKQTSTQTLRNKLRQAREEAAPPHIIADLGKSLAKKKHELLKVQHQVRQKSVTDALHSSVLNHSPPTTSPHSLWDLLRYYKTDHVQSNQATLGHCWCNISICRSFSRISFCFVLRCSGIICPNKRVLLKGNKQAQLLGFSAGDTQLCCKAAHSCTVLSTGSALWACSEDRLLPKQRYR